MTWRHVPRSRINAATRQVDFQLLVTNLVARLAALSYCITDPHPHTVRSQVLPDIIPHILRHSSSLQKQWLGMHPFRPHPVPHTYNVTSAGELNKELPDTNVYPSESLVKLEPFTDHEAAEIGGKLEKRLGPEWVASRQGPGGSKLHYLTGEKAIILANTIFGWRGWSSAVKDVKVDFVSGSRKHSLAIGV